MRDRREYSRQYRLDHPDKVKEYSQQYYLNHKDKCNRRGRAFNLKSKFGMTIEDYDTMLAEQGGGCAICGADMNFWRPALSGESETPVHLPPIDFSKPTQDPMTEVRKGVGGERRENK
jgi:hypothetical protein